MNPAKVIAIILCILGAVGNWVHTGKTMNDPARFACRLYGTIFFILIGVASGIFL